MQSWLYYSIKAELSIRWLIFRLFANKLAADSWKVNIDLIETTF